MRLPTGALVAALTVAAVLLAGCTSQQEIRQGGGSSGPSPTAASSAPGAASATGGVDVSGPALRKLRRQAGIAPCPAPGSSPGSAPSGQLPDATLPCLGGGNEVDLAHLRGPLVLNLWAQWCGPCREELPYYEKLHQRAGDRLQVLGVDYLDPQPAGALQLAEQTGVTYPLLADPKGDLRVPFRVNGLPVLVLVDAQGDVVSRQPVAIRSYQQLRDMVRDRLGVKL